MSILEYFPGTPRDVQSFALSELEKHWDEADVFVLSLPTGSGKSHIANTISQWAARKLKTSSRIIVPNNMLVDQYKADFPHLHTIYRKDTYECVNGGHNPPLSCTDHKVACQKFCRACPYMMDVAKVKSTPVGIYNFYTYMAYKAYRPVLIIDEAHTLLSLIQGLMTQKFWQDKAQYPASITSYGQLYEWAADNVGWNTYARKILNLLEDVGKPKFVIEKGEEKFRGRLKECLSLKPVDTSAAPDTLWPRGVSKIILMSATIGKQDLQQMGLDKRRVCYIDTGSPIDAERRPVVVRPIANMSGWNQDVSIPQLVSYLNSALEFHSNEKGLIHLPYSLALKLKSHLNNPRYLFHERDNKQAVYEAFKRSSEPRVLIASGMWEGVNLPYEDARWQIIAKIPWPSLGDSAVKYMSNTKPDWYAWETLKTVIQGCGRVCRASDDYGVTYILDSTFKRLYDILPESEIPRWWRESLVWE